MDKTSSRQFIQWSQWLKDEWNHKSKQDHYLARIAYGVYLLNWTVSNLLSKNPADPKLSFTDFLMSFSFGAKADTTKSLSGTEKLSDQKEVQNAAMAAQQKMAGSKSAWLGFVGFGRDGKLVKRLPPPKSSKPPVIPKKGKK